MHLIDKSAFEQGRLNERARSALAGLTLEAPVATCPVAAMEILYSARNKSDFARIRLQLKRFKWLDSGEAASARAMQVQALLADSGGHRVPITDLMIAASAELGGATVLHYDKHFDLIAEKTGQSTRWIVPRGEGH